MRRSLTSLSVPVCVLVLGFATTSVAGNNLNLIPGKGIHFGIVKRSSTTITVTLERSGNGFHGDLNDNDLLINDVPAGTVDARPVFDGTDDGIPFTEAFPLGAYELIDTGWGAGRELLASRGCVQQKSENSASWDNGRVYCSNVGIEKIKVAGSNGNDLMTIDPNVTALVQHKCRGTQAACGRHCFVPTAYACCDPTPAGYSLCWVAAGDTCGVDATYCEQ
jgi:hypothetical protein